MQCVCLKLSLLSKSNLLNSLFVSPLRPFILEARCVSNSLHGQISNDPLKNLVATSKLSSSSNYNTFLRVINNFNITKRSYYFHTLTSTYKKEYRYRLSTLQKRLLFLSPSVLHSTEYSSRTSRNNTSFVLYFSALFIFMIGVSYAAVPLYRIFCQATGIGGDPTLGHKIGQMETMEAIPERRITVTFNADHHSSMQWNFKPTQRQITVVPGETALAFYTAKNPTNKPIVGIATYNVVPFQAGLYFNKIQCFCFEEQWLNPNEEVDMPVFFYIDPDFDSDPQLADTENIILSYTFFKAQEGQTLPLPGFMKANSVVNLNAAAENTAA